MFPTDSNTIAGNSLLFAAKVAQSLSDMVGANYAIDRETFSDEPFVHGNGVMAIIHFGGYIQGDYIVLLDDQTAISLATSGATPGPLVGVEELWQDAAGFLSELLNVAVGQTIHQLEESYGILSYVPAVVVFGSLYFPRVNSLRYTIRGDFGAINCILALNLGDMKIARRIDQLQVNLAESTRQAYHDQLTHLYSRVFYEEVIEKYLSEGERYGTKLGLLMIDVDFFKQFNDRYGHAIGDMVLSHVAAIIRLVIRRCDIPVRYGGDEVLIIMPETDAKGSIRAAERISQQLAQQPIEITRNGEKISITITLSIGVSQYCKGDTREIFFKRVDDLLYKAKQLGRNRIESDGDR